MTPTRPRAGDTYGDLFEFDPAGTAWRRLALASAPSAPPTRREAGFRALGGRLVVVGGWRFPTGRTSGIAVFACLSDCPAVCRSIFLYTVRQSVCPSVRLFVPPSSCLSAPR
jgi:hypothetical protein